jgi:uncharacterized protein YecT (DUF1311 family)
MRLPLTTAAVLFLLAHSLAGQSTPYQAASNSEEVCKAALTWPLPPEPSGPLSAAQLKNCDEEELYYGFSGKPNYAAALQCGWYQRTHPEPYNSSMFRGPGVLAMLYANGYGVARDYKLAMRFVCENEWSAEAELDYRLGHLAYLRDGGAENEPFDLCTDATSGLTGGWCADISARTEGVKRERRLHAAVAKLPPAAREKLPALQKAEAEFEKTRVETEIDLSGTLRGAFQIEDEQKLREQFVMNLTRFAAVDIPKSGAAELAKLDGQLNEAYQRIQHSPAKTWEYGTIKPEGIQRTQRTWIKLAAAWEDFGRVAYPSLSSKAIRAQLIRLRLHQLRSLLPQD